MTAAASCCCRHPIDNVEHRHQADREARVSDAATAAHDDDASIAAEQHDTTQPACVRRSGTSANSLERLLDVVAQCGSGLAARDAPLEWHAGGRELVQVATQAYADPVCIRLVVALSPPGQRAEIVVSDGLNRPVARGAGSNVLLLPSDGPLCLPEKSSLTVRVASGGSELSGHLSVLLSP